MRKKKAATYTHAVSEIIKISEDERGGLLGFTIAYSQDDFENVVQGFLPDNYDFVLAELNKKRKVLISRLNKEGWTR